MAKLETNWDAITAEVLELRSTRSTTVRTMDIQNPYVRTDKISDTWQNDGGMNDFDVFKSYVDEVNYHIATTSYTAGVSYAEVYLAFSGTTDDEDPKSKGYLSFDGVHPNNTGHRIIAGELWKLGYAPLR